MTRPRPGARGPLVDVDDLVSVAVHSPDTIVATGLATLVRAHPYEFRLVPPAGATHVPDVVLYDVVSFVRCGTGELTWLLHETASRVVAVARDLRPDLAARARALGVHGTVSLSARESELVAALRAVTGADRGDHGDRGAPAAARSSRPRAEQPFLGMDSGLTRRESDVLAGIACGLSNVAIAAQLHVSTNSLKTYIRTAYRKIQVTTRPQAVSWAILHGFPTVADDGSRDVPAAPAVPEAARPR